MYLGMSALRSGYHGRQYPNTGKRLSVDTLHNGQLLVLGVATSLDAWPVGITFSLLRVNVMLSMFIMGMITALTSVVGVRSGGSLPDNFQSAAEMGSGLILIVLDVKVLFSHLQL